jgi:hypothetical protein
MEPDQPISEHLFSFPAPAILAVFEQDALCGQVVADGGGAGEVAGFLALVRSAMSRSISPSLSSS